MYTEENTKHLPENMILRVNFELNGKQEIRRFTVEKSIMIGKTEKEFADICGQGLVNRLWAERYSKLDTLRLDSQRTDNL